MRQAPPDSDWPITPVARWLVSLVPLLASPPVAAATAWPAHAPGETAVYRFQGTPDAADARGTLVAGPREVLFGATILGGGKCSGTCGAIYALTPGPAGYAESVAYSFGGGGDGWRPYGKLAVARSGALLGVTSEGGAGYGTVYALTPARSGFAHKVVYRFAGGADGVTPLGGLTAGANDTYYGTTEHGGSAACSGGCGTVFRIARRGNRYVETVLYAFAGAGDGSAPEAGVIVDRAGDVFGTTANGGGSAKCNGGCGTAFELVRTKAGYAEHVLHAFGGGTDGAYPQAAVLAGPRGTLYGTTFEGGGTACNFNVGCGTVFALTPGSSGYAESTIYHFSEKRDPTDGYFPVAELVADASGTLYGTTLQGGGPGGSGYGTVFALAPAGGTFVETILHRFAGGVDGEHPYGGLWLGLQHAGLELIGTTAAGGDPSGCGGGGCGTVFGVLP